MGENVPPDHLCTGDPGTGVSHLILCVCRCTEHDNHFFVGDVTGTAHYPKDSQSFVHQPCIDNSTTMKRPVFHWK